MLPDFNQKIRNVQRARELVSALVRYGFGDAVQSLGLDRLVQQGRRTLRMAHADDDITRLPRSVRLRRMMEELGPTFVKLAQILSTRPDLIPSDWAEEFAKLQDDVAQVPGEQILEIIQRELGARVDDLFESIEPEALAAASIAQVHRATLKDGTKVVLKVQRPGLRELLKADMEVLEFFAHFIEKHFQNIGYSPTETVDQFARELRRETDFTLEGRATDRMRLAFEDMPDIHFPQVYWDATTSSVLCLEYIDGTVLSRRKPDEFTEDELQTIVANGARAVFRQCLEIGFFHADPHPGNIVVLRDDEGRAGPICFIDCGMTGHIDPKTAEHLADLTLGTVAGELDRVIDMVIAITDADPVIANNRVFRSDVWEFISHFEDASFSELQMGSLLGEFFEKIRRHRLHCPADMVFLIKAMTTIEGVGEELCPTFDIVEYVRPYVERLIRRRYGIRALRSRLRNSLLGYTQLAETLPRDVSQLMSSIRKQQLTMNLEHRGLDRLTESLEHASRNIAQALIITALVIASSILVLADSAVEPTHGPLAIVAMVGFSTAVVLAIVMVFVGRLK